jgi:DNA-binding NarL/FixJ family response regulator
VARPRVLLAEDHPSVAEELRRVLEPEFEVVAVVSDGPALLREAEAVDPDVIVTDLVMPRLDGIAATSALLARRPGSRVVLVTVHDEPDLAERGYAAGALAFVAKLAASRDLVPAVRAALRDERWPGAPGRLAPAARHPPGISPQPRQHREPGGSPSTSACARPPRSSAGWA